MATDGDFNQAFASFARRENLPSAMTSEEWSTVPSEIRERAFFMSQVVDEDILAFYRGQVDDVLSGVTSENDAEKKINMWMTARGYKATPGKEGGLEDLNSLARINVVIRTNVAMARGHAAWVRKQTAIRTFPAQRFLRISEREVPRDWEQRWNEASEELAHIPGVHPTEMVALLNHPIWTKISRFDQPYPPFDFGSGMGVESVRRDEAKALGFKLDPNNDPLQQPIHRSMNEGLEVDMVGSDAVLRESLSERLGRFGEWDGGKIVFTDPDGTRKYPAEKLAEIWKRPAPAGYDRLTQKDALDDWDGGLDEGGTASRIKLRQLFDRIETKEQPEELWRAVELRPADAFALIRGLSARKLMIPGNVAGWDWVTSEKEIGAMTGTGWRVVIRVRGVTKAIDIRALRLGRPGFVYVGGTPFKVDSFTQDKANRRVLITLSEDAEN